MKKRYWVVLVLLFLVGLDWYIRSPDSHSRALTQAIETQGSSGLQAYPYKFRVLKVVGETAYLSTPRNTDVPAYKALGALFPGLNTKDPNNPDFIAAQHHLAEVQSEARAIVLSQPGIKDVRWELDREWLSSHYIEIPAQN